MILPHFRPPAAPKSAKEEGYPPLRVRLAIGRWLEESDNPAMSRTKAFKILNSNSGVRALAWLVHDAAGTQDEPLSHSYERKVDTYMDLLAQLPSSNAKSFLYSALAHPNGYVRQAAVVNFFRHNRQDAPLEAFGPLLMDWDPRTRTHAVATLLQTQKPTAIPLLVRALRHPHQNITRTLAAIDQLYTHTPVRHTVRRTREGQAVQLVLGKVKRNADGSIPNPRLVAKAITAACNPHQRRAIQQTNFTLFLRQLEESERSERAK